MAIGAGKYDDLCTYVREQAKADGAIVMVLNGNKGFGFSVQVHASITPDLPRLLERMAADLRASIEKDKP